MTTGPSPPISSPHPRRQTEDPSGTTTRVLPPAATGTPARAAPAHPRISRPVRGARRRAPLTNHDISPPDSSDSMAGITTPMRGGDDVGAQSTVQRSFSGAREQLMPLAPCPVEGCPVGVAHPPIPLSMPDCSLRFSRDLAASPLAFLHSFGTGLFAKVLATTALTPSFWACFTLETAPDLDSSNSRKSLYTGMTADPAHFRPLPQKGGRASPPKCGMVSRLTAPHTRRQSDRQ